MTPAVAEGEGGPALPRYTVSATSTDPSQSSAGCATVGAETGVGEKRKGEKSGEAMKGEEVDGCVGVGSNGGSSVKRIACVTAASSPPRVVVGDGWTGRSRAGDRGEGGVGGAGSGVLRRPDGRVAARVAEGKASVRGARGCWVAEGGEGEAGEEDGEEEGVVVSRRSDEESAAEKTKAGIGAAARSGRGEGVASEIESPDSDSLSGDASAGGVRRGCATGKAIGPVELSGDVATSIAAATEGCVVVEVWVGAGRAATRLGDCCDLLLLLLLRCMRATAVACNRAAARSADKLAALAAAIAAAVDGDCGGGGDVVIV